MDALTVESSDCAPIATAPTFTIEIVLSLAIFWPHVCPCSSDVDVKRNVLLLKGKQWLDIPIVYNGGSRAVLAIEKGAGGERAFKDAFAAWGQ